jgi:H/ACA ribonucleoprotein complex subunit 2
MTKNTQKSEEMLTYSDVKPSSENSEFKQFILPIANPLLSGKLAERALRLLKKAAIYENQLKQTNKGLKNSTRQLKRGVAEVSKALRKGQKGIVFLAADVYPVDIIAHFPVFCEKKDVLYCFIGNKRTLGTACRTHRPASVIMLCTVSTEMPHYELYEKFHEGLKSVHPYF